MSELSMDGWDFWDVLSNERRRCVIIVVDLCGEISLSKISKIISAYENNKTIEQVSSKEKKRVYVTLYQSHLDDMKDMGCIEYDRRSKNIKRNNITINLHHIIMYGNLRFERKNDISNLVTKDMIKDDKTSNGIIDGWIEKVSRRDFI